MKQRSLSESLSRDQLQRYEKLAERTLRRERQILSQNRYNKMKMLIIREVEQAIQEADYEPTASVMNQSVLLQEEDSEKFDVPEILHSESIIMLDKTERSSEYLK